MQDATPPLNARLGRRPQSTEANITVVGRDLDDLLAGAALSLDAFFVGHPWDIDQVVARPLFAPAGSGLPVYWSADVTAHGERPLGSA